MNSTKILEDFLAEVVMTGYYLAEPVRKSDGFLHDAEMKSLKIIETFQPLSLGVIAKYMHCGKARATQLVHTLEAKRLVTRTSGNDHRVVYVRTTKLGSDTVKNLRIKYRELASNIEVTLGHDDTKKLCEILSKITPLTQFKKDKGVMS